MKHGPENPELTLNVDLLAPEGYGELIGGGAQRIGAPKLLEQRMKEHNLKEEDYKWYYDLIKYDGVPHCGFGMGLERCVAWMTGVKHVRETIPFLRMINRITP
jgi:asparaginyl-tRNA synthetase